MAGMDYKMTGDEAKVEKEGYTMNGKEVSKGKGMDYEMVGSDPKIESAKNANA